MSQSALASTAVVLSRTGPDHASGYGVDMDKSQLRELARRYTNGELPLTEYRREREALIDAITEGRVSIERKPVAPTPQKPHTDQPASRSRPAALSVHTVVIGVLVLALAVWLIYPLDREPPAPAPVQQPVEAVVQHIPGPGERIVEEFLTENQWHEAGVSQFESAWVALTEVEREEARRAGTVGRLLQRLSEQLEAHQATYDLTPSETNWHSLNKLYALGQTLGVDHLLNAPVRKPAPVDEAPATPAAMSMEAVAENPVPDAATPATDTEPPPATPPVAVASEPEPEDVVATTPDVEPAAVSVESDDTATVSSPGFTLQLFTLSNRDNAQNLLDTYPQLDLKVWTVDNGERYRVLYGRFVSKVAALNAYDELPPALTPDQSKPLVRQIPDDFDW